MSAAPDGKGAAAPGWAAVIIGLAAIAAVCAAALVGLDAVGKAWRVPRDGTGTRQLIVASSGIDAVARLEQAGVRGAYMVQLGANSAFEPIDFASTVPTDSLVPGRAYPFGLVDVQRTYVEHLSPDNYMLVALRTSLARKVDHVVSPGLFDQVRASALAEPNADITVGQDSVRINEQGEVRRVLPAMPKTNERLVVLVNASYFSDTSPEELASTLQPYLPRISYLVVSDDGDDATVTDQERARSQQFVQLIVGSGK